MLFFPNISICREQNVQCSRNPPITPLALFSKVYTNGADRIRGVGYRKDYKRNTLESYGKQVSQKWEQNVLGAVLEKKKTRIEHLLRVLNG